MQNFFVCEYCGSKRIRSEYPDIGNKAWTARRFCNRGCRWSAKRLARDVRAKAMLDDGVRECRTCKLSLPLSNFPPSAKLGIKQDCTNCRRFFSLVMRQGVAFESRAHYEAMLRDGEERGCAICSSKVDLHFDHDHETGTVRGLICADCNTGLGLFADNPRIIHRALMYLVSGKIAAKCDAEDAESITVAPHLKKIREKIAQRRAANNKTAKCS